MLGRREHAFGAPQYIINRYNAHLAQFKVTRHAELKVSYIVTYKQVTSILSGPAQEILFRTGKVLNTQYSNSNITTDVEFIGFGG
jgi:hypothetical protein